LTKAKLVDTLSGTGPFTVFAPTDEAFAKLLADLDVTAEQALASEDLADQLLYHVVAGKVMSSDVTSGDVKTMQGADVKLTVGSSIKINDATVISADNVASNGVIHVIDKVIIPPTVDIVGTAMWTGNHGVLAEALTKAKLVSALQGTGPFTVFAPTDTAFTAALAALNITKQELLDRADLADILKHHVLSSKVMSSELKATQTVSTLLAGKTVTITKDGSVVKFATATVTGADVAASNGVIHVIDKVVLPPAGSATGSAISSSATSDLVTGTPLMMLMMLCLVLFSP